MTVKKRKDRTTRKEELRHHGPQEIGNTDPIKALFRCNFGELTVRELLDVIKHRKASLNIPNCKGRTVLHYACAAMKDPMEQETVITCLLENGACLYVADQDEETPLSQLGPEDDVACNAILKYKQDKEGEIPFFSQQFCSLAEKPPVVFSKVREEVVYFARNGDLMEVDLLSGVEGLVYAVPETLEPLVNFCVVASTHWSGAYMPPADGRATDEWILCNNGALVHIADPVAPTATQPSAASPPQPPSAPETLRRRSRSLSSGPPSPLRSLLSSYFVESGASYCAFELPYTSAVNSARPWCCCCAADFSQTSFLALAFARRKFPCIPRPENIGDVMVVDLAAIDEGSYGFEFVVVEISLVTDEYQLSSAESVLSRLNQRQRPEVKEYRFALKEEPTAVRACGSANFVCQFGNSTVVWNGVLREFLELPSSATVAPHWLECTVGQRSYVARFTDSVEVMELQSDLSLAGGSSNASQARGLIALFTPDQLRNDVRYYGTFHPTQDLFLFIRGGPSIDLCSFDITKRVASFLCRLEIVAENCESRATLNGLSFSKSGKYLMRSNLLQSLSVVYHWSHLTRHLHGHTKHYINLAFYRQPQAHPSEAAAPRIAEKPPTGFIALVFTDVQSSTHLWEVEEDAMQEALMLHNSVMRREIVRHSGYEVKTEGDAFMVTFFSPLNAVNWCTTVQLKLLKLEWPQRLLHHPDASVALRTPAPDDDEMDCEYLWRGLRVRMGVHCGRPYCRSDAITKRMDYFGPQVNLAARVAGQGCGGQIVLSANAYKEVSPYCQPTQGPRMTVVPVVIQTLGEFKLKGIDGLQKLYQLLPKSLNGRQFSNAVPLKPKEKIPSPKKEKVPKKPSSAVGNDDSSDSDVTSLSTDIINVLPRSPVHAEGSVDLQAPIAIPPVRRGSFWLEDDLANTPKAVALPSTGSMPAVVPPRFIFPSPSPTVESAASPVTEASFITRHGWGALPPTGKPPVDSPKLKALPGSPNAGALRRTVQQQALRILQLEQQVKELLGEESSGKPSPRAVVPKRRTLRPAAKHATEKARSADDRTSQSSKVSHVEADVFSWLGSLETAKLKDDDVPVVKVPRKRRLQQQKSPADDRFKPKFESLTNGQAWLALNDLLQEYRRCEAVSLQTDDELLSELRQYTRELGDDRVSYHEFVMCLLRLERL